MNESIKRQYLGSDVIDNNVNFFQGIEVEKTIMYGKMTMFVVGLQDSTKIIQIAKSLGIEHIYLGANKSFHQSNEWEPMVDTLLQAGLWVTLDFPVRLHNFVMRMMGNHMRQSRFIPMISIELPNVEIYNYNTTIKIDDIDMDHSNPGVWCHSLHDLLDRDKFTTWDEYNDDKVI